MSPQRNVRPAEMQAQNAEIAKQSGDVAGAKPQQNPEQYKANPSDDSRKENTKAHRNGRKMQYHWETTRSGSWRLTTLPSYGSTTPRARAPGMHLPQKKIQPYRTTGFKPKYLIQNDGEEDDDDLHPGETIESFQISDHRFVPQTRKLLGETNKQTKQNKNPKQTNTENKKFSSSSLFSLCLFAHLFGMQTGFQTKVALLLCTGAVIKWIIHFHSHPWSTRVTKVTSKNTSFHVVHRVPYTPIRLSHKTLFWQANKKLLRKHLKLPVRTIWTDLCTLHPFGSILDHPEPLWQPNLVNFLSQGI